MSLSNSLHELPTPQAFAVRPVLRAEMETLRISRGPLITQLVTDVRMKLERLDDGTLQRALLRKLESLRRAVERWTTVPPCEEQSAAMLEMLLDLDARADSRTMP